MVEKKEKPIIYGIGPAGNYIVVLDSKRYKEIWGISPEEHFARMLKEEITKQQTDGLPPSVHQSRKY